MRNQFPKTESRTRKMLDDLEVQIESLGNTIERLQDQGVDHSRQWERRETLIKEKQQLQSFLEDTLGIRKSSEATMSDRTKMANRIAMRFLVEGFEKEAKDLPKKVEEYVDKFKEDGYDESYAWSMGWSLYCKHKNPDSPHCKQDSYLDNQGKSSNLEKIARWQPLFKHDGERYKMINHFASKAVHYRMKQNQWILSDVLKDNDVSPSNVLIGSFEVMHGFAKPRYRVKLAALDWYVDFDMVPPPMLANYVARELIGDTSVRLLDRPEKSRNVRGMLEIEFYLS